MPTSHQTQALQSSVLSLSEIVHCESAFHFWQWEGVVLGAVNPSTLSPWHPSLVLSLSHPLVPGVRASLSQEVLKKHVPQSTAHQTSLILSASSPNSIELEVLHPAMQTCHPLYPRNLQLQVCISPAASVVGLHLGYVRPRALSFGQESELPDRTIILKNGLGQQHKHGVSSCATLEAAVLQDLTVSKFHTHCPITQRPPSLCPATSCSWCWFLV